MNPGRPTEELLDDIAVEAVAPGFRDALLDQALAELSRRQKIRRVRRNALLVTLTVCLCFAAWQILLPTGRQQALQRAYGTILSQPLELGQILSTEAGTAPLAVTIPNSIAQFSTPPSQPSYRLFNDSDLLAFLEGKQVVLVSSGPRHAELVFLNPEDAEGFELQ